MWNVRLSVFGYKTWVCMQVPFVDSCVFNLQQMLRLYTFVMWHFYVESNVLQYVPHKFRTVEMEFSFAWYMQNTKEQSPKVIFIITFHLIHLINFILYSQELFVSQLNLNNHCLRVAKFTKYTIRQRFVYKSPIERVVDYFSAK